MNKEIPIWEKQLLTIDEAALYTNIGQNRISELLKKPSCSFVIYIGRKKLVKRKEFEKFLSENIELD
ncbi:MAG: helix-turn-helix domain-containing protein [Lachnospiraceae bacterium]|nr:helix-turn-helix domain-containing protein [Lachnospiraceae bacterium]